MKLKDPITGETLVLFTQQDGDEYCGECDEHRAVRCIAIGLNLSEDEVIRQLQNSDIDHPVRFRDEIFWTE